MMVIVLAFSHAMDMRRRRAMASSWSQYPRGLAGLILLSLRSGRHFVSLARTGQVPASSGSERLMFSKRRHRKTGVGPLNREIHASDDRDRILFVGGPYDGTWRTVLLQADTVELPTRVGPVPDLPFGLSPSVTYLRTELELGDGEPSLKFYRLSTLTARQAVAWVLAGYGEDSEV